MIITSKPLGGSQYVGYFFQAKFVKRSLLGMKLSCAFVGIQLNTFKKCLKQSNLSTCQGKVYYRVQNIH